MIDWEKIWTPPPVFKGETVFIIGGGPSIKKVKLSLIYDKPCIGANMAFMLSTRSYFSKEWLNYNMFGDYSWWLRHKDQLLREYDGEIVTCCPHFYGKPPEVFEPRIKVLVRGLNGLEQEPKKISWNNTTGGACVSLAVKMGARRIILVGFDMKKDGEKNNFHNEYAITRGEHSDELAAELYPKFMRSFEDIKRDADRMGIKILNANPDSAMKHFPFTTIQEEI